MQVPVLLAIDEYPALSLPETDYGVWATDTKQQKVSPSELRLAAGLQLMMREAPKRGLTVCAAHASSSISPLQPVPIKQAALLPLQRYTLAEIEAALSWYTAQVGECMPQIRCYQVLHTSSVVIMSLLSESGLCLHLLYMLNVSALLKRK